MEKTLGDGLSMVGYNETASGPTSHIYCLAKQVKAGKRGLGGKSQLHRITDHIADHLRLGFNSPGDGELPVGEGITFEHVERSQFEGFRRSLGVSEAEYVRSMNNLSGGGTQDSGKSGSLFWFSQDQKYVLKSATAMEVEKLCDMLTRYISHVEGSMRSGCPSLLARFYGIYILACGRSKVHLVAMNNVFPAEKPERIYDIKGTTEDRFVEETPGHVMKDLNYAGRRLQLPEALAVRLTDTTEADSQFLLSEDVMDYSLILGVFPAPAAGPVQGFEAEETDEGEVLLKPASFQLGIIDFLVEYTAKKKAAHWLKKFTIGCFEEIDTEPPPYYQERFQDCMEDKITS